MTIMKTLRFILILFLLYGCSPKVIPPGERVEMVQSEHALQGRKIFMSYCNSCHPGGTSGLGPSLINKPLPGFAIRFQVRNGLGVMPAFSKEVLSEKEVDRIIAYIKEL